MGKLIAAWSSPPATVTVFGSAARGDGGLHSDIDVLVVRPAGGDEVWEEQLDGLREHVASWTGNPCQVYELTEQEFVQHVEAREPIVDEWRRDAVVVTKDGRPVAALVDAKLFERIRRVQQRFDALADRLASSYAGVPEAEGLAEIGAAVRAARGKRG